MGKFTVITEIYLNSEKVLRTRKEIDILETVERNHIIVSEFQRLYGQMNMMDIYAKIKFIMMEKYDIKVSERQIMRIVDYRKDYGKKKAG